MLLCASLCLKEGKTKCFEENNSFNNSYIIHFVWIKGNFFFTHKSTKLQGELKITTQLNTVNKASSPSSHCSYCPRQRGVGEGLSQPAQTLLSLCYYGWLSLLLCNSRFHHGSIVNHDWNAFPIFLLDSASPQIQCLVSQWSLL